MGAGIPGGGSSNRGAGSPPAGAWGAARPPGAAVEARGRFFSLPPRCEERGAAALRPRERSYPCLYPGECRHLQAARTACLTAGLSQWRFRRSASQQASALPSALPGSGHRHCRPWRRLRCALQRGLCHRARLSTARGVAGRKQQDGWPGRSLDLGLQDVRKLSQGREAAHLLLSVNMAGKESPGASESYVGRLTLWVCLGFFF